MPISDKLFIIIDIEEPDTELGLTAGDTVSGGAKGLEWPRGTQGKNGAK